MFPYTTLFRSLYSTGHRCRNPDVVRKITLRNSRVAQATSDAMAVRSIQHPARRSIKQVLPPLRFAVAEHAHEVAAGMQTERPRLPQQLHAGLFRSPAALMIVAGMATGHQVLPGGLAGARPRSEKGPGGKEG